jgi:hypothetical protein
MSEDGSSTCMEPAEGDGPERDLPDIVVDFFETDVLAAQEVADVDPGGVPSDAAVGGDLPDLEVDRVRRHEELGGEGTSRRLVDGGGWPLPMGFVRPDLVEVRAEGIEATLLGAAVSCRRDGGLGLEILVHAFVATVLLGLTGFDEIGQDAELDPPDGEARETAQGHGGEGRAVISANALWETELTEGPGEDGTGSEVGGSGEPLAGEEEATEAVLDGERIAVDAVEGLELALEVGGPDGVGSVEACVGSAGMRGLGSLLVLEDEAFSREVLVEGLGSGKRPVAMELTEAAQDREGRSGGDGSGRGGRRALRSRSAGSTCSPSVC